MKPLTKMQQDYVYNRAAGLRQREAAVAAGYSAPTADRQASVLEKRADIKKAIANAKKRAKSSGVEVPDDDSPEARNKMPKAKYADSKDFLLDAMNHKHLPIAARAEYTKALLPYQHARIGETGKKESAAARAKKIAEGGKGKSKFATKAPPQLHVVGGKG